MGLLRKGKAQSLTIYIGESDQWQEKPLYAAIVQLLRENQCAGATVTRAIVGYGAGARLHESGHWHWSSDAPVVIQVVDQPERLQRLLPQLREMLSGGLMTLQDVEVLKYTHGRRHGLPSKLPVRQIMETSIITVNLDTPVAEVVDLLLAAPFRALPVVDAQQRLKGIISSGDLINAGLLPMRRGLIRTALELDSSPSEAIETFLKQAKHAEEIMNKQVRAVESGTSLREAAQLMLETDLRRLPVTESDGKLVGMLTRVDLLQAVITSPLMSPKASSKTQPLHRSASLPKVSLQRQPISEYTTQDALTIDQQTPIFEVIDALVISPFKRVIVVDNEQRVIGIISDVDVLLRMQEEVRPGLFNTLMGWARSKTGRLSLNAAQASSGREQQVAAEIMNRDVVTVTEITSVQDTIERMIVTRRKVLPVVDGEGRFVGVVGRSDLLRILLEG